MMIKKVGFGILLLLLLLGFMAPMVAAEEEPYDVKVKSVSRFDYKPEGMFYVFVETSGPDTLPEFYMAISSLDENGVVVDSKSDFVNSAVPGRVYQLGVDYLDYDEDVYPNVPIEIYLFMFDEVAGEYYEKDFWEGTVTVANEVVEDAEEEDDETQEEKDYDEYAEEFDELEDDYRDYKKKYRNAVRDDERDADRYSNRLEDVEDDLEDLEEDVEDLVEDIEDGDDDNLLEKAKDLLDDIEDLRDNIDDLLSKDKRFGHISGSVFHSIGGDYSEEEEEVFEPVVIKSLQMPTAFNEPAPVQETNDWQGARGLAWMIAGIVILAALIIFLMALLLR
jgi:hypothetical protein